MRPLDGIKVVTLEHAIAAPFCTRQLADLGARVIKVERPGVGDFARGYDTRVRGLSSHFVWTNRSKESITLDIKDPTSHEVLMKLVEGADVVVQNLGPGAAARLGLSYKELSANYPNIIVCDISGYGAGGPYEKKKAYDLLIQSESGFVSVTGTEGSQVKAGNSIADISAGMYAFSGILSALLQRGKTGRGSHVEISMLETMTEWMSYPLYYSFEGAPPPPRSGASHATIYPYGPFEAGDGKFVMLGLQNEREWLRFCDVVLGEPELANDQRFSSNHKRNGNREAVDEIILEAFSALTAPEIVERLELAGIANARINTMSELWDHPQLKARQRWSRVQTSEGFIPALLPPGMPEGIEPRMDAVPSLGEHTVSILRELGCSDEQVKSICAGQGLNH